MNSTPFLIHSDRLEQILLLALEEILGQNEVDTLFYPAHRKFEAGQNPYFFQVLDTSNFRPFPVQSTLVDKFGPLAGRGLSLRVGRACLKYSLREFGSELGMTSLAFRLLPLRNRLKVGSEALTGLFNQFTSQPVRFEMEEKKYFWHIERPTAGSERRSIGPGCALVFGFIQEAWNWMSGGKYFQVEERSCMADGDNVCTMVIDQTRVN
jgi:hypothetical protein